VNDTTAAINEKIRVIDEINDRIWKLRMAPSKTYDPIAESQRALDLSKEINYEYGLARSTLNFGMGEFILRHNAAECFRLLNEALEMFRELKSERWISNTQLTIAILGTSAGRPEESLYAALKGFAYYNNKDNSNDHDAVMAFYVIGTVYKDLKNHEEAKKYYERGLTLISSQAIWFARIYSSLANILTSEGKYENALHLAEKSLEILIKEENKIGISRALSDIGIIQKNLGNYSNALKSLFESLKLREEAGVKQFILGSILEIAEIYKTSNDVNKALNFFLRAEKLANETGHNHRRVKVFRELAQIFKQEKNYKKSIVYFEKYIALSETLNEREKALKIESLQNTLLQEKEKEIERLKNVELKEAYEMISEKNKEITDSIHYAQRIQKTLLATDEILKSNIPEYFVVFNPKDIVSGDFYWATKFISNSDVESSNSDGISNQKPPLTTNPLKSGDMFFLAVCDSTGHGVPGAFMSLLNITFLNEAINQKHIFEPGKILNYVRERLISSISQDGAQDGMDGTLICLQTAENKKTISYASANNFPLLISNGKLITLEADKMPVGKGEKLEPFSTFTLSPKEGDILYLCTDGYADQFGGPNGKKFRSQQLEKLLLENYSHTLDQQKDIITKSFLDWKGMQEQIDDVLITAIKF
jgi:serine phosphatase RsbU (regulator of sigma subunit)